MTTEVGNILKSYLEPLRVGSNLGIPANQFIDKLAGVVKTVTRSIPDKDNRSIKKSFPVACGTSFIECNNPGVLTDLVPNDKLGCIVYFEDLGVRALEEATHKKKWKASYRLVGWINNKKLGVEDCSATGSIVNTLLNQFPSNLFNVTGSIYQSCSVDVIAQDPKSFNPFSKYSYDESVTQYLMYPFDYFSLQIDIDFSVHKSCVVAFEKQNSIIC